MKSLVHSAVHSAVLVAVLVLACLSLPAFAESVAPQPAPAVGGVVQILSGVPLDTWALVAGMLAMVVLQLLGTRGAAVRATIDSWIDMAYYAAEALARASPGGIASKGVAALDAFHRGLLGEGIRPSPADVARAQAAWAAKAEAEHVQADVQAKALTAAKVAGGATASQLLAEAGK